MGEKSSVKLPLPVMEQLLCYYCKGFLSCGPLRVQKDGNSICGRCCTNSNQSVYRMFALETVLREVYFPCRFNKRGCEEILLYDKGVDHEIQCNYRSFNCPLMLPGSCVWEGPQSEMLLHFNKCHKDFVKEMAQFNLFLDQDSDETVAFVNNDIGFIAKYCYKALDKSLKFDVVYCSNENGQETSYKVQLFNAFDHNLCVSLKLQKCTKFTEGFYELLNGLILDLNNYLLLLEDPMQIDFNFTLKYATKKPIIDYNFLDTLRCNRCFNYLIPPLYDLDGQVLCQDCGKKELKCVPLQNEKIDIVVANANFPCRWRSCTFIGNSTTFKEHDENCMFRQYDCFYPNCDKTFDFDSTIFHLRSHKAKYLSQGITYETCFAFLCVSKCMFTIKSKIIVLIQHSVIEVEEENHLTRKLRIALFSSAPMMTVATVNFQHGHCKLKSKSFILICNHNTDVNVSDCPPCFKNGDVLLGTVIIQKRSDNHY